MTKAKTIWVAKIPNTEDGHKTLEILRKNLSPNYEIRLRGRGFRYGGIYDRDLPLSKATSFAVYLHHKNLNLVSSN